MAKKMCLGISTYLFVVLCMLFYNHHFYDDEIWNITWITNDLSWNELLYQLNRIDVHPPLSYILNKVFYILFDSLEFAVFINCILISISLAYFYSNADKYVHDKFGKLILFVSTFLNPAILMWGTSLRWYSNWISLFILLITIAIFSKRSKLNILLISTLLICLTYFGYLTLFLLIPVYLILVVGGSYKYKDLIIITTFYVIGSSYQLYFFLKYHIHNSADQVSGYVNSTLNSMYSLFQGGSFFVLSPLNVIQISVLGLLVVFSLFKIIQKSQENIISWKILILIFASVSILILTGIGGKFRNGLFLNLLLMLLISIQFHYIKTKLKIFITSIIVILFTLSTINLITHSNTGKNSYNLPIREIISSVNNINRDKNVIILTYDPTINYELQKKGFNVITRQDFYHLNFKENHLVQADQLIVIIETYQGSITNKAFYQIRTFNDYVLSNIEKTNSINLGKDKYYNIKNRLLLNGQPKLNQYQVKLIYGKSTKLFEINGNYN